MVVTQLVRVNLPVFSLTTGVMVLHWDWMIAGVGGMRCNRIQAPLV
jgi:hypothetical protein